MLASVRFLFERWHQNCVHNQALCGNRPWLIAMGLPPLEQVMKQLDLSDRMDCLACRQKLFLARHGSELAPISVPSGNEGFPSDASHAKLEVTMKHDAGKRDYDRIKKKSYPDRLGHYTGNILCVGIRYEKTELNDPPCKKHACDIESMQKAQGLTRLFRI